ncbi:hypothetical protein [Aeromonas enteropelogenes]|uniref:Uncharacterized protein n=1 Tax=Aeromonas enteropelogenes TaxID=29489 RepID=A0A175VGS0_AEREN|nr:hypothetical protein [Aeromonas enteropelogenes]KXU79916.1 hypothetical protein LCR_16495 [Aeromonas enteropelogenes]
MKPAILLLLSLPFCIQAAERELWLVELEHNDGLRLQFQGAELELGSARLEGIWQLSDLRPGMRLAIWSRDGVAEQIGLAPQARPSDGWRRAQAPLIAQGAGTLSMAGLGEVAFDHHTRWLNGGPGDLQLGRELVLTRDEAGSLQEILVVNPEDEITE